MLDGNENAYAYTNDPLNQGDLDGQYSYQYDFLIGPISRTGTATHVYEIFRKNPVKIFPFEVRNCPKFTEGAKCTLLLLPGGDFVNDIYHTKGVVKVHLYGTSVKFTVTSKGYFDEPRSSSAFTRRSPTFGCVRPPALRRAAFYSEAAAAIGAVWFVWAAQANNLSNLSVRNAHSPNTNATEGARNETSVVVLAPCGSRRGCDCRCYSNGRSRGARCRLSARRCQR